MITAGQLRASRAILGIDQRALAEAAGLSLPTIQRMEASEGVVRGNVDSLMKLVASVGRARHRTDLRQCAEPRRRPRRAAEEDAVVTLTIALACAAALLALAVVAVALCRFAAATRIVYGACMIVAAISLIAAAAHLLGDAPPLTAALPLGVPWLGAHFRLDALSAFFLIVVDLGTFGASLFALGYGEHETAPQRVLPFYAAFLAGMTLVVLADDAFTFLLCWEFMSLTSWALVMSHHRVPENVYAGYVYLIMASFGTLALLLGFGLLAGPGGLYSFDAMRAAHPSATIGAFALILALIGAGSKAGIVPLHAWLPLAHPAAPSHVSALMSGVMTKVAVYAFVRIAFELCGAPAWWWSIVVLAAGGVTAVMGVLYALMQHDLKRLLAYHTVENIGIIFIGLGLALAFQTYGLPFAAALALTAALFHVFNHSLFKSLLFFGAGAVLTATGERDMEHLGGLIHRMPQTAFVFLVGCAAISALPPLNGFASEWLTFQAILLSPALPSWGLKIYGAGRRRPARAVGGARGGLFRQGLWRDVSRTAADAGGSDRQRNRLLFARGDDAAGSAVSRCRNPARPVHRRARSGQYGADRRAHAAANRRAMARHHPDHRKPQLL